MIPNKARLKFYSQDWHVHPRRDWGLLTVLDFPQLFACAATEIEMTALDLRSLHFLLHNLGKRHLLKEEIWDDFWLKSYRFQFEYREFRAQRSYCSSLATLVQLYLDHSNRRKALEENLVGKSGNTPA